MISVDLSTANFQAVRAACPDLVSSCDTYEEWIGRFTPEKVLRESKPIRQQIFGKCNPKAQQTIQRRLIARVFWILCEQGSLDKTQLVFLSNDEFIFKLKQGQVLHLQELRQIPLSARVKFTAFSQFPLDRERPKLGSVRLNLECHGSWKLHKVPAKLRAIAIRKLRDEPVEPDDCIFLDTELQADVMITDSQQFRIFPLVFS